MTKLKKWLPGILLTFVILFVIFTVVGSFFFYNLSVARNDKSFLSDSSSEEKTEEEIAEEEKSAASFFETQQWIEKITYQEVTIESYDGLTLTGYYIPAANPTTKTIIIAHGYSSKGFDMAAFAMFFHEKFGYNVLLPDARGHGQSEGNYVGFGWPERKDYLNWIDWTIQEVGTDAQIGLIGVSMGGATVMMVSGEKLPSQVKAIIEDCGYSSVFDELSYQIDQLYKLPAFPLVYSTSVLTDLRAGYNFIEASAVDQVAKATVPMLFIHGDADTFVPTEMVYKVFDACSSPDKELWIVPGAGHGLAHAVDADAYERKVYDFLSQYISD